MLIAFDDLQALPQPGDAAHDDTPDGDLVARATRATRSLTGAAMGAVTGAAGRLARQVVSTAVDSAVAQVTRPRPASRANAKATPSAKRRPAR